jgi:transcription initiation factor TFIID TATA-box-binding protein
VIILINYDVIIDNVVGHVDLHLKNKLNLENIMGESESAEYEPEQFPGLVFIINEQGKKIKFTIYRSGKILICGSKSKEELERRAKLIVSILEKYIGE